MKQVITFLLFVFSLSSFSFAQNCDLCTLSLPDLPEDTLFLSLMPDGTVGTEYQESLSFRMPKTTTPVNVIDPGTPAGLDIQEITLISVSNLPPGITWEATQTFYEPAEETDGCLQFCGTPLLPGMYDVEITIAAKVSIITQTASFSFPMVILPASGNTDGFGLTNNISCGETTVDFTNNVPSNGQSGISYFWDFGNGNSTIIENPQSQTYTDPGVYPVIYQAVVDTVGFILTNIEVLESGCRDLPSFPTFSTAPDMNITVYDANDNILFETPNYDNTFAPIEASCFISLTTENYRVEVIDDDGGLNFGDDDCGTVNFNRFTVGDLFVGDLTVRLTIIHPTDTIRSVDSVTIYEMPASPLITPLGATDICNGQSVILTTNYEERIQWFQDSILLPGATTSQLEVAESGLFYVRYESEVGCPAYSGEIAVMLLSPPPTPAYTVDNNELNLFDESILPDLYTIQWLQDGVVMEEENGLSVCIDTFGNYTLVLIDDATGCRNSFTLTVPYNPDFPNCVPVSTEDLVFADIVLFPNPVEDMLMIRGLGNRSGNTMVTIWSGDGRMIGERRWSVNEETLRVDTRSWVAGLYVVRIQVADGVRNYRMVKQGRN